MKQQTQQLIAMTIILTTGMTAVPFSGFDVDEAGARPVNRAQEKTTTSDGEFEFQLIENTLAEDSWK